MHQSESSGYLRDLGFLLREIAVKAKRDRDEALDDPDLAFLEGRLSALHEVVSLMQEQAVAFGIESEALALGDIDPDRDLL